ncbi:MAG: glycosyltransferase 87 family protein [Terriglobales bacterium]
MMAATMWLYVDRVFVPQQAAESSLSQEPRGSFSDLYPRWMGTREWLVRHGDPYSIKVTREIQQEYWGRSLDSRNAEDPRDESRFAYPAYVIFLLAPTIGLSFPAVQVQFFILLALLTALSAWTWADLIWPGTSRHTAWIALILTMGSCSVVQALLRQQLSLLVAMLITASVSAVIRKRLGLAGVLLGLATIEPALVAPLAAWYGVWIAGDFRRRHRLLWSFLATLAVLIGASELALPGWESKWWLLARAYLLSSQSVTLLQSLLGRGVGLVICGLVIACVIPICWRARHESADSPSFVFAVALVLTTGLLVIPKWSPYDQVLLLPAILLLARDWMRHRLLHPVAKLIRFTGILLLGWQWFWAAALVLLAVNNPGRASHLSIMPLLTILMVPLVVFVALVTRPAETIARPQLQTTNSPV